MKLPRPFLSLSLVIAGIAPTLAQSTGSLSLGTARELALKTHPRITVAELRALVAHETVTVARSGFFPVIGANATAVGAGEAITRVAAGGLSNSQIFDRVGVGANATMLLTDFGRTANLTAAARLQARAADANVLATRAQLLLEVDTAYFAALEARAVKAVAEQTLQTRQVLFDRAQLLAKNQLKSDLDVRFAKVGVGEASLLVEQAERNWQAALATLANLLGERATLTANLLEEPMSTSALPASPEPLFDLALRQRPELTRQRSQRDAAQDLALAARDARLPTVTIGGAVGVVPVHDSHFEHNYAAGGVNVNVPLFAGGIYRSRQREAELEARAADAGVLDEEDNIIRDVRLAWLDAGHAHERIELTANLLENANDALELAKARFEQGLGSVIELNQAELAQTSAAIEHTNAEYDYRVRLDLLDFQTGSLH